MNMSSVRSAETWKRPGLTQFGQAPAAMSKVVSMRADPSPAQSYPDRTGDAVHEPGVANLRDQAAFGPRWSDAGRAGGQHEDTQDLEAAQDLRHDPLHINVEHLRS